MLPRSFLKQLIPARIAETLRRIERSIWVPLDASKIAVWQTASRPEHRRIDEVEDREFSEQARPMTFWGPKYAQRWFKLRVPRSEGGVARYLQWNDQAEATLYHLGRPYYGLDLAHRHCPLPEEADDFYIESVCIRTGIWLDGSAEPLAPEGSRYEAPRLFRRDDAAWSVYHDLKVLLDIVEAEAADYQPGAVKAVTDPVRFSPSLWRASLLCRRLCDRLERAIEVFERDGLGALATALRSIYADFPAAPGELKAVLTGHAHIDLVWLWPERVGEFKTVHSWATQARLLAMYPEYRFGFSQPACYEAMARRAPELHREVIALIREGRWEATGGTYVESDTQLPCGEALLRSVRLGQKGFEALRGTRSKTFWLPDVFGYSGVMPQLLRAFGIESFFTTKLSWSTVNRFPHTSFKWRGYDGSEIGAHVVLLHDYNEAVNIKRLREDGLHHQQAAVHPELLVPTGYGDGGGGATEAMCERARRIGNLAGAPKTSWGSIEGFFDRLGEAASELPVVAGELSLELHRGVFTTHGRLKSAFRGLERALQIQEAAHAVSGRGPVDEAVWKRLIFAQFHDYVPGSSIWEVYAEGIPELETLAREAGEAARTVVSTAGEPGWFNPLPVSRDWVQGGVCYRMAALSGAPLAALAVRSLEAPKANRGQLASDRVEVTFDARGSLKSLRVDGNPVAIAEGGALCAYPDRPAMFEAWDIDRHSVVSGVCGEPEGEPRIRVDGLTATLSFSYVLGLNRVVANYSVTAGEPVLRIDYDIDWQEPEMLLKAIFCTAYTGREARFGAPFGSVLRGQQPGYSREEAAWEVPASRWMVVMDDAQSEGLAIVTEAKYGFCVRDGAAGVSLLRSALVTEADLHPEIRDTPNRPRHSDLGFQRVRLALGRHSSGNPTECHPAVLADSLYTPCVSYRGDIVTGGLRDVADAPTLVPAWVEPVERGRWILRLHEVEGRQGVARIRLVSGWKACLGTADHAVPADGEGAWAETELLASYRPYQIVSIAFAQSSV